MSRQFCIRLALASACAVLPPSGDFAESFAATAVPASQIRAEDAALAKAIEQCRAGQKPEAARTLAKALQNLPQAHRAVELLVRFARQDGSSARVTEEMESWTIPPESTEVGLPGAWRNLRGRLLPEDSAEQAQTLLLQVLANAGEAYPEVALELARRTPSSDDAAVVKRLQELGGASVNVACLSVALAERRGNLQLALSLLEPVLRLAPEDPRFELAQARLMSRLGRARESIDKAQAAMLRLKRTGTKSLLAEALLLYGEGLAASGGLAEASAAYELGERAAAEACDEGLAVRFQVAQGTVRRTAGQYGAAEALLRSSVAANPRSGEARAALARLLEEVGEPQEALEHFEAAAEALRGEEMRRELGWLRADWGQGLAILGRHGDALRVWRAGLEDASDLSDRGLACTLLELAAGSWRSLRHPERGTRLLEVASALAQRDGSELLRARVACGSSETRLAMGEPQKALDSAEDCRSHAKSAGDDLLGTRARILGARSHNALGKPLEGLRLLAEDRGPAKDGPSPRALSLMAEQLLERGRAEAATEPRGKAAAADLQRAARLAEGLGRTDVAWRARFELALLARAVGRRDEALSELERCIALLEASRPEVGAPGSLADRSVDRLQPYEAAISLLLGTPAAQDPATLARAWELADRRAGRRARDLLPRPQDGAANPEELRLVDAEAGRARELHWARAALAAAELDDRLRFHVLRWIAKSGLPPQTVAELQAARSAQTSGVLRAFLEELEAKLATQQRAALGQLAELNPRLASLVAPRLAPVAALQSELGADEALLGYVLGQNDTAMFILTRSRISSARLPAWKDLAAPAKAFVQQLSRAPRTGQSFDPGDGSMLYQVLLETPLVQSGLQKTPSRLSIIAEGPILDLPFEALPRSKGGFLLEDSEVCLLPAAWWRIAAEAPDAQAASGGGAVLFGAPFLPVAEPEPPLRIDGLSVPAEDFATAATLDQGVAQIPPSSAVELQAVATHLGAGTRVLLEGDAVEAAILGPDVSRANVLHFAVPGIGNGLSPERSGLALAQSEGSEADGFVELGEILRLRLHARFVAISGSVPATEGGVLDLGAAFLYAGADGVVATLWQAGEESSVYLMQRLYASLAENRSGAALRQAQLALLRAEVQDSRGRTLKKLSHPHFWAGFQRIGRP